MEYNNKDLDDFINMLISYRLYITSNTRPHPNLEHHTQCIIALEENEEKFNNLLFPKNDSNLLGLTIDNPLYESIYGEINNRLRGLDIDMIQVFHRYPFSLAIQMKSKEYNKGGKKRYRKIIKSTKKKRHIKKKRHTKKRR
jgi:hypothetical protein